MRIISGAAVCACRCTTRELTESWQVIHSIGSFPFWLFLMAWVEKAVEKWRLPVEALGSFYEENRRSLKKEPVAFLTGACENMNEAVCRYSRENCINSMGTTMALLSFSEKAIYACNLGDSRIYRHFQGKLRQISTDHVIGGKMLGKAPLTQYLGFQEENMALEPSIVEIGYQTGSSYLICSDGVTDMLSDEEIREILGKNSTAEEKVEELLEMALAKGGRDNVTMVLAQISGYEERNPLKRWAERYSTGR